MEVRPGYKQTEVGVIPADWRDCDISDLCTLQRGFDLTEATRKPGIIPVYSSSGLSYFHNEAKLHPPAVITGRKGLLGRVFLVEEPCWPHDTTLWVKDFKGNDPKFVSIFLSQFKLERFDAATSVPTLNRNNLIGHPIRLPPLPEQRAIAEALTDVDALLEGLDRLIAKKRDLKQAAMQQLLTGQTRLPGFSGEWEVKRLGDVAEMGSGGTPSSSVAAYYDGDIPWVSISDMTNADKIIESTERNLTALGYANSATQMFPAGTVLYAMYASLGECSIAGKPLCTSQAILGIRAKRNLNAEFLYYYLTSLKPIVKSLGQQGTQSNLNKGMVQNFRLSLPLVPEQTAIAAVLSDMDAELSALLARRDKTRDLKQAMMQELLTGKTRLVPIGAVHA